MRDGSLWDDGLLEGVEDALYRGDGVGGKALPHHRSALTLSITIG
jgi:hypothetical protein